MGSRGVVAVTGASPGVERASAVAFARRGAWVGLLARNGQGLGSVFALGRRSRG